MFLALVGGFTKNSYAGKFALVISIGWAMTQIMFSHLVFFGFGHTLPATTMRWSSEGHQRCRGGRRARGNHWSHWESRLCWLIRWRLTVNPPEWGFFPASNGSSIVSPSAKKWILGGGVRPLKKYISNFSHFGIPTKKKKKQKRKWPGGVYFCHYPLPIDLIHFPCFPLCLLLIINN